MTVSLNMIVGAGESHILRRCLESFGRNFDEIVIVNTSDDADINSTAFEFTKQVFKYQWKTEKHPYGNFGGARQFAADNSTSDYIMWLDSDDVLLLKYKEQFEKLLGMVRDPQYSYIDLYCVPYSLVTDDAGNNISSFMRERIFKRELGQWNRPVHELIECKNGQKWAQDKTANINGVCITHQPIKPQYASALRNIQMLEHEHFVNKDDSVQTRYFLARDYLFAGKADQSEKIFDSIVDKMETSYDMLYIIAMDMIWFYAYGQNIVRPRIRDLDMANEKKIEKWLRLAISFASEYAEPLVILGDLYFMRGETKSAESLYKLAMTKKPGKTKMLQSYLFYTELPVWRLAQLYFNEHQFEHALYYNRLWLPISNHKESTMQMRKSILDILSKEISEQAAV